MICFDIETGALPLAELEAIMPEFEPSKALKDPEKIAADIAGKRSEWIDRAALSPVSGQILAIGYIGEAGEPQTMMGGEGFTERFLIEDFWDRFGAVNTMRFIGFNCKSFDIPFLVRRSWKYGIKVPREILAKWGSERVIDLLEVWKIGNRDQSISLNNLCKYLGLGEKTGNGKYFAEMMEADPIKAREYLEQDILLTRAVAQRLGIISAPF